MTRRTNALGLAVLALAMLTGCAGVTPYGVANHDAKAAFHEAAALEVLGTSIFEGIAETENFTSVGYAHAQTSQGETLHTRLETTVWGTTYKSQQAAVIEHGTIDVVHMGGSMNTYFLFGDAYLPVTKTPWVSIPQGDIGRTQEELCRFESVQFLCGISNAWTLTQEAHGKDIPVQIEVNADGSRHVTSAVTFASLHDAELFTMTDELRQRLGDEVMEAFIPLHVWLDPNGVVTKVEVNGQVGSDSESLQAQFGFELTGEPNDADKPTDPATLDQSFVTQIPSGQVGAFWTAINEIRDGK